MMRLDRTFMRGSFPLDHGLKIALRTIRYVVIRRSSREGVDGRKWTIPGIRDLLPGRKVAELGSMQIMSTVANQYMYGKEVLTVP